MLALHWVFGHEYIARHEPWLTAVLVVTACAILLATRGAGRRVAWAFWMLVVAPLFSFSAAYMQRHGPNASFHVHVVATLCGVWLCMPVAMWVESRLRYAIRRRPKSFATPVTIGDDDSPSASPTGNPDPPSFPWSTVRVRGLVLALAVGLTAVAVYPVGGAILADVKSDRSLRWREAEHVVDPLADVVHILRRRGQMPADYSGPAFDSQNLCGNWSPYRPWYFALSDFRIRSTGSGPADFVIEVRGSLAESPAGSRTWSYEQAVQLRPH